MEAILMKYQKYQVDFCLLILVILLLNTSCVQTSDSESISFLPTDAQTDILPTKPRSTGFIDYGSLGFAVVLGVWACRPHA